MGHFERLKIMLGLPIMIIFPLLWCLTNYALYFLVSQSGFAANSDSFIQSFLIFLLFQINLIIISYIDDSNRLLASQSKDNLCE